MAKCWYKNPWIIAIGAPILVAVILDLFKIIPLWNILKTIFTYSLPAPLAVLILVLFALLFIGRRLLPRLRGKDERIKELQGKLESKGKKVCINGVFYATDDNGAPNLKEAYC